MWGQSKKLKTNQETGGTLRRMIRKIFLDRPQAMGNQTPASTASVRGAQAGKLADEARQTAREFDSARSASELVPSGSAGGGGRREPPEIEDAVQLLQKAMTAQRSAVQTLRRQVAALSTGVVIPVESLLSGQAYTEISADQVDAMIDRLPDALVLDIRPDASWDAAHMPSAKHVVLSQLPGRLGEMPDQLRPIVVVGHDGADGRKACELLVQADYVAVFNGAGGMAAYRGKTVASSEADALDITKVEGTDKVLIAKIAKLLESDVRPTLMRDGGDLELIAVHDGIVKVRLVGACHGCGAASTTLHQGIKTYVTHTFPEITDVVAV